MARATGRWAAAAAVAAGLTAPLAAEQLPPVFEPKQVLVYTDEVISTPYKRPGDGRRNRLRAGWYAFALDRNTVVDDRLPAVRKKRVLDHQYYPSKKGRILRMNNISEFCAWAKSHFVRRVEFVDLGKFAGIADCDKSYEHYWRTQHPENEEAFYADGAGGPGKPMVNPFLGRPKDAMYGDYFFLETRMEQRRADARGRVSWRELGEGDSAEGNGLVRFYLTIRSEDILPLKITDVVMTANAHTREDDEDPRRIDVLTMSQDTDFPLFYSPGDQRTYRFRESEKMRDVGDRSVKVHFLVDYEDPWGNKGRKHVSTYYWKVFE